MSQLFTHELLRADEPESMKFADFHFTAQRAVFLTLHQCHSVINQLQVTVGEESSAAEWGECLYLKRRL